jgi:hypothetical protein
MEVSIFRPASPWTLTDILETRRLRLRVSFLLCVGRLLGDEFMKLAGRFDLSEAQRRPIAGSALRRARRRR